MNTLANPVLESFRAALQELYGDRIDRILLFGSQARGEATSASDYDVAIFLKDLDTATERWTELNRLAALRVRFLAETGAFFDALPYPSTAYNERSLLMHEIRKDGVTL